MNSIGNRNSTPEVTSSTSSLRPPSSARTAIGAGHSLRQSADLMGPPSMSARGIRPASEVIHGQRGHGTNRQDDLDSEAQRWLADIDSYEDTLEQMAAATLDQDFKDELSAIEQWFRVLSEAERTSALYALLQQTTQVQTRFFIATLTQMAKNHPVSGVLSPSGYGDKDPITNRLSGAMNRLSVDPNRNSTYSTRPPPSPGAKRASGLDQAEIYSMFPDAAAAIAKQKADFTKETGTEPRSNRSSAVNPDYRNSQAMLSADPRRDTFPEPTAPWGMRSQDASRPKSSQGHQPMGQFTQAPLSAGLPGLRPPNIKKDGSAPALAPNSPDPMSSLMSPFSGNWGSVQPTPMDPTFNFNRNSSKADILANTTAMKLAALTTVTNRVQLDDPRKYRRARSSEGNSNGPPTPGLSNPGYAMTNEHGQLLTPQQAAMLQAQAQQMAAMHGRNGRGTSTSALGGQFQGSNGLLSPESLMAGVPTLNMPPGFNSFGSDYGEHERGRSPRGKRGTSRPPPEDPTDPELLKDIPGWLRSLRLHKYTDNLKDMRWQDLVQLDEQGLEDRGVAAKGARSKMLKVFQDVRAAQDEGRL